MRKKLVTNLLEVITPLNIQEEKEKFFKNSNYNPVFQYLWQDNSHKLYSLNLTRQKLFNAIKDQNYDEIAKQSRKFFKTRIKEKYLKLAKEITKKVPEKSEYTIEEITEAFIEAFSFFNLDYKVNIVDEQGFNVRPSYANNEVTISKFINLDFLSIEGEVKHELSHIIRGENHRFNKLKNSARVLPTEEGLACFVQDYTGEKNEGSLYQHAVEYLATEIGLKGSLRDIYNFMVLQGFDEEHAWSRAIRHKFGFIDTSLPGDILKPGMYFYHEQEIRKLSKEQILTLFSGKISKGLLKKHTEYKGFIQKEKIEEFFGV